MVFRIPLGVSRGFFGVVRIGAILLVLPVFFSAVGAAQPSFQPLSSGIDEEKMARSSDEARRSRTLTGHWFTGLEDSGPLEAVFTPTADRLWEVSFGFEFQGRPHVFSGTAEGELGTGALAGEVVDERQERTFVFSGVFEDGVFQGEHAEMEYGVAEPTGTLSMSE